MEPRKKPSRRTIAPIAGEIIRRREELGWNVEQLATATGYSAKTIENLETGKAGYLATFAAVATALGVPVQSIMLGMQPHTDNALAPSPNNRTHVSVTVSADADSPEDFRYLCQLMADALETYKIYKSEPQVNVYYVPGSDKQGEPMYFYALVAAKLHQPFIESLKRGICPDFAVIVEWGEGHPTSEIMAKIKQLYGFDHNAEINRPLIANAEQDNVTEGRIINRKRAPRRMP
jgi:transcriptional regulator with XRE-family HTH domain